MATSTLELGVDVGDLDIVVQLDAPHTVSSFLQRLGRAGRRHGATRNTLFLATDSASLLRAAALLLLWSRGFVEPIAPPPSPRHIAAQQFLALALQEGQFGPSSWREWWGNLAVMDQGDEILDHLRSAGFLEDDGGLVFIGPEAERHFGRRHFMDLLATFTAAPELRVIAGRTEVGTISPLALATTTGSGPRRSLLLAGQAWKIEAVHWDRREVLVSEHRDGDAGKVRWPGEPIAQSYELARAQRDVLLGTDPPVTLSQRAHNRLSSIRAEMAHTVSPSGLVLARDHDGSTLWTWAGLRANETLLGALGDVGDVTSDSVSVSLPSQVGVDELRASSDAICDALPNVTIEAVDGLKFSAALPPKLAQMTLAERAVDRDHAREILQDRLVVTTADSF